MAFRRRGWSVSMDAAFRVLAIVFACSVIFVLFLVALSLLGPALPILERFGPRFLTGVDWIPVVGREAYGALPYVLGTIVTSGIALLVGVPLSLGIAIFLAEMAPSVIRTPVSFIIELLAAVPSVIYGLWGLFVLRFWIRDYVEAPLSTYLGFLPVFQGTPFGLDILTGGVILAIMIVPTVSSGAMTASAFASASGAVPPVCSSVKSVSLLSSGWPRKQERLERRSSRRAAIGWSVGAAPRSAPSSRVGMNVTLQLSCPEAARV